MSPEAPPSATIISHIRKLLGLSGDQGELGALSLEALLQRTRRQLLDCARYLDLTGIQRLTKDALAGRLQQVLRSLAARATPEAEEPSDRAHRFDLGRPRETTAAVEHIPWGYGQDRVTAMVVDPDRLYVYWEVTDEAIARARADLGPGGRDATLTLRLYDVTNRIFDGTNAHSSFEQRVERTDRQWFFFLGKPTSTSIVELGLKSPEGQFVRMARSGRADFPRREPTSEGPVEWLTVHAVSGDVGQPAPGVGCSTAPASPAPSVREEPARVWDIRRTHGAVDVEVLRRDESLWEEWVASFERSGERSFEWHGPLVETTWEAGPFSLPVAAVRYVEERYGGDVTVHSVGGTTRVVYGPWRVVIRGIGASATRRILAVWETYRSGETRAGASTATTTSLARRAPSGSGYLVFGASERTWLEASEVRLGGASEIYLLGASEIRFLGASETLYSGASERMYLGASERLGRGASDDRLRYPDDPEGAAASSAPRKA